MKVKEKEGDRFISYDEIADKTGVGRVRISTLVNKLKKWYNIESKCHTKQIGKTKWRRKIMEIKLIGDKIKFLEE